MVIERDLIVLAVEILVPFLYDRDFGFEDAFVCQICFSEHPDSSLKIQHMEGCRVVELVQWLEKNV